MHVLMIEDRMPASEPYVKRLSQAGLAVKVVSSGDPSLLHVVESSGADVLILSLPFEEGSAVELVRTLRAKAVRIGIMAMQETRDADESIDLLDAGADDVVTKPCNQRHLAARVRAVARRLNGHADNEIVVGALSFRFDGRPPMADGRALNLSKRERALLECLAMRAGHVVSRNSIFSNLYGNGSAEVDPKIIDVYICKLRKKLREAADRDYITTVFGMGYMLSDPDAAKDPKAAAAPEQARKAS